MKSENFTFILYMILTLIIIIYRLFYFCMTTNISMLEWLENFSFQIYFNTYLPKYDIFEETLFLNNFHLHYKKN